MNIEPLNLSALEALSKIIGDCFTGSEITALFRKAGFPSIFHDGSTKWRFVNTALEQLQKEKYGPVNIIKIIEKICDPQEYFSKTDQHKPICDQVNQILTFYALKVGDDGKVRKIEERATTLKIIPENKKIFDERKFHNKVIQHSKQLFIQGNYFHAVFESCKVYDKEVSLKSKIDDHGSSLMANAFSLKGPLKLNTQTTESEKNEQEGLMHLSLGIIRAVRNPQSHEPALDWPITIDDALDLLSFLSLLFRKLDKSIYFK